MDRAAEAAITPFRAHVPDDALGDLRDRLRRTRWPEAEPVSDWSQGIPRGYLQDLCRYWAEDYDWRVTEARLNAVPQFRTRIDGLDVHYLHRRSPHPSALPVVLTHGWPGSVLEFLDLLDPLTDPTAHGGAEEDAFDVVVPSLPGYGFSGRPTTTGWGVDRIAGAWARLMERLGYRRYGAAGSDWGTSVSSALGRLDPDHVAGIHLVPPLAGPDPDDPSPPTAAERTALGDLERRARQESAYSEVHRTKPQTIGYALVDSPAALCAWIVEKMWSWTDHNGDLHSVLTRDRVLDDVSLYWFTQTGASSARLYAESIDLVSRWISGADAEQVTVPTGASIFGAEVPRPSRRWVERRYPDLRYWAEHARGGHFAAWEAPDALVEDLRRFFRPLR
ncbi:epoxide hydrolase 1 [Mumia sp. zg.B53]|uniref:epoxide hydrolase family protein n=1 Tax=Mumia sp. zg.B53 TaxID=2855449 RepID=UPI001C6E344E|nr:epoxide hydrolase family protein [Mumia sp. zg.B53]MBW9213551.1 epoxide hydrolase 1 [Mumia sp. zg.B53]